MYNRSEGQNGYKRSRPLQQHIFRMFGGLFCAVLFIGSVLYLLFVFQPRVEQQARALFNSSAYQLERSLSQLLQPAQSHLKIAAEWAASSPQAIGFAKELNRLFIPLLRNNVPITLVVAGSPEGQGYTLWQQPDGTWLTRFTDVEEHGTLQHFALYAADGTEVSSYVEDVAYDHRQRPWFQAAMQTQEPDELCWTAPFELFTSKELAITLSTRVERDDGSSLVIGLVVVLRDISRFTTTHQIGANGFMLVMSEDEHLIGYPPAHLFAPLDTVPDGLHTVEALNSQVVEHALAHWNAEARPHDALYRFSAAGQDWYSKIRPYPLGDNRFWVAMFAPRADFAPRWPVVASYIGAIMLVMLGLVLLVTRRMAQRLAASIASVAANSEAIARLDFRTPAFGPSNIREIESLMHSHTQMSALIRENLAIVEAQKKELSQKVEELHSTRDRLRENEVKLQQNLNYVQAFFDSPLMGIALVRNRTFTDCNRTFCALTGYAPSEVKGMPTRDLYANEQDYLRIERESAPVLRAGKIYTTEVELCSRSGFCAWARISGCLFDRNDPAKGSMWIAIPVPEGSRAAESSTPSV